jgi:signal transduction histidine kinase
MDMKKIAVILFASVFLFACIQSVFAAGKTKVAKPTKEEVLTFVNKAVDYAKKNGKEKALKEFMNRKGPFVKGELYIYAYDFKGTVIAHGGQPELVGKNLLEMKDKNGVMVIEGLINLAKSGGGWLRYMWPNPLNNNRIEPKLGYAEKVDDTWWLGSGIYE